MTVLKTVATVTLILLPGGFVLLMSYAFGRAFHHAWTQAKAADAQPQLKDVLGSLTFRDVLRQARAAF